MLCGKQLGAMPGAGAKAPGQSALQGGWRPASRAGLRVHSGLCGAAADEVALCLPGGEDRRPGWLEAEAWHTGTYLDVNIFSGESSWEMRPHRERLCGSLESGPDGFLPSCTTILRRL